MELNRVGPLANEVDLCFYYIAINVDGVGERVAEATMSVNGELTVDEESRGGVGAGRRAAASESGFDFHPHNNSYKKREVYEKLMASKKGLATSIDGPSSSSSSIMEQSTDNPGPSSLAMSFLSRSSSRQTTANSSKRDSQTTNSSSSSSSTTTTPMLNGAPPLMTPAAAAAAAASALGAGLTSSFRSHLPDCKPHPVIFGENIFIECSLLKSNLLLLKDALSNPNLAVVDLQTLIHDVRRAKEVLVEQVSLPLIDIQRELQEKISLEHAASVLHATNPMVPVYSLHEFRTTLPNVTTPPSASNPYPSHLYLYPVTEPLTDARRNATLVGGIPEQNCPPFNAQPAH